MDLAEKVKTLKSLPCKIVVLDLSTYSRQPRYYNNTFIKMSSPKVWSRFNTTRKDGTVVNLRIQDMPSDRFEDVMDFNINYFVKFETFHKAAGVPKNPKALQECRKFISEMMKGPSDHMTICCLDDSDTVGDILGVSSMSLMTKDEDFDLDDLKITTKEWKKFFDFIEVQHSLYDVMEKQNVEKSYDGRGMAVHPDYRGLGIATEFCKVRRLICKDQDVPITWAWMTSLGSQKAAERAGWETAYQISFVELAEKLEVSSEVFDGTPTYCKIMIARI